MALVVVGSMAARVMGVAASVMEVEMQTAPEVHLEEAAMALVVVGSVAARVMGVVASVMAAAGLVAEILEVGMVMEVEVTLVF